MNLLSPLRRLSCAILLALPALALPAEEPPAPKNAKIIQPGSEAISIDFPGGPLSKLVANLNSAGDAKLSIVQAAGLDPELPAFSVRNVRVDAVIAALGRIVEPQGYILNPIGPNLAVLAKLERPRGSAFASLQLDRKLVDGKVDDIITAIQQGCEFANEGRPSTLRFKYHPGTKLLFVAGTEQEVDVAYRVYGSLPDAAGKPGTAAPEKK